MKKLISNHWPTILAVLLGLLGMSLLRWKEESSRLRRFEDIRKEEPDAVDLQLSAGGCLNIYGTVPCPDPSELLWASSIKTWSAGEVVRAADLNANFNHLHDDLGHDHGAVITNGDISASAAIAHSKLATPGLVAKAKFSVASTCGASPCTVETGSVGVTSVTRTGAGAYPVTLSYTPADLVIQPVCSSLTSGALICYISARSAVAPHFQVNCADAAGVATDCGFTVIVMD